MFAQDQQTMQQAIQWQHAKDAADARQAALEAKHPGMTEPGAAQSARQSSADREDMSQTSQGSADRAAPMFRTEPTAAELQQAVAWEHQKDAAAARQAASQTRNQGASHAVTNNGGK
jgi:hypothetical protein